MLTEKYKLIKRKIKETVLKKTFKKWTYLQHHNLNSELKNKQLYVKTGSTQWGYSIELLPPSNMADREVVLEFKVLKGEIGISVCDSNGQFKNENFYSSYFSKHKVTLFPDKENCKSILIRNTDFIGPSEFLLENVFLGLELSKVSEEQILTINNEQLTYNEAVHWSKFYGNSFPVTRYRALRHQYSIKNPEHFKFQVNGLTINYYSEDESCRAYFLSGFYEPIENLAIRNLLQGKGLFIDIGANQGFHSLTIAKTYPNVTVHAFEPSSREFKRLQGNVSTNSLTNILTHQMAIGSTESRLQLRIGAGTHTGHNTLCNKFVYDTTHKEREEDVQVISLDYFSTLKDLKDLKVIKIDVEGFEPQVFKGAMEVLKKYQPDILFELAKSRFTDPDFFYECGQELQSLDYRFYIFNHSEFSWSPVDYGNINEAASVIASTKKPLDFLKILNANYKNEFVFSTVEKSFPCVATKAGTDVFLYDQALAINEARLEHLASLGVDFKNKLILEVGGGIGLHTPFFLSQGAKVHFTDARLENIQYAKETFGDLVTYEYLDLNNPPDKLLFSSFDYIYCYGTLYHLSRPESGLNFLSQLSAEKIFLETCISPEDNDLVNLVREDINSNNQAFDGTGCRPSQSWILRVLKNLWGHSYECYTTPNNPDFPIDTTSLNSNTNHRSVFVGSKDILTSNQLSTEPVYKRNPLILPSQILKEDKLFRYNNSQEITTKLHIILRSKLNIQDQIKFAASNNLIIISTQNLENGMVVKCIRY